MTTINVLVALRYPLFAEAVATVLHSDSSVSVIGTAHSSEEVRYCFEKSVPDVVVLDMQFVKDDTPTPSLQYIRESFPSTAVIVLSEYAEPSTALQVLNDGARAYLLKDTSSASLRQAVKFVHSQSAVLDRRLLQRLTKDDLLAYHLSPHNVQPA